MLNTLAKHLSNLICLLNGYWLNLFVTFEAPVQQSGILPNGGYMNLKQQGCGV